MNKDEIMTLIIDNLEEEFEIDRDMIQPSSHLFNDLELDSLDTIDLILEMERSFNIKVNSEDAKNLLTVDNVVDFIAERINE